jgi:phosphate starvation-inducible PhoH-like protein
MHTGDIDLSRSRGQKAQQRRINTHAQTTQHTQENTIDFHRSQKQRTQDITLVPRSRSQEHLARCLLDESVPIVIVLGPAGTGKSYLAMLAALRDLRLGRCDRVILTRPAVAVEDERHGFLPGDLIHKMEPWTRPLLDIMKEFYAPRQIMRLIDDEIIEISPLAFMRGRTFKNAWIVADEMQNATPNQMKMLLTRIGSGSRIVVTGDVEQTDRTTTNNGLLDLAQRLRQQPADGLQVCELGPRDIQRHPIIDSVLRIYG